MQIDLRLNVPQGAVGAELAVVGGFEVRVQHFPQQRPGLPLFMLLVLHGDVVGVVVRDDSAP